MSTISSKKFPEQFNHSSGVLDAVWIATEPYSAINKYKTIPNSSSPTSLDGIVVVGAGISGITVAYELVERGVRVMLVEGREILSGETGRTTGHLSSGDVGDRYYQLIDDHGKDKARLVYESHQYAVNRVGEISKKLGIDCEYRKLPAVIINNVSIGNKDYDKENDLPKEYDALKELGIPCSFQEQGKLGDSYKGSLLRIEDQATFHPTKYLVGILKYLDTKKDLFQAFTNTRYQSHKSSGDKIQIEFKTADTPDDTISVKANAVVQASNVPHYKSANILKQHYFRTYAIAAEVPKDKYDDILLYDNDDPYIYVRKSAHPDSTKEYLIIGGEDHKVGKETKEGYHNHFSELEKWGRENFGSIMGTVAYKWSGQVVESSDAIAYIGKSTEGEYIVTGDNGNGLTHGTLAGKLIADQITGKPNAWIDAGLYDPARKPGFGQNLIETLKEDALQVLEYKRLFITDVNDIEEIPRCSGAVMHAGISELGKPIAVYKDENGELTKFSAICPHLKGVVAWNDAEKSWDCPVHGSRFDSGSGKCVMGPSVNGLHPENELAQRKSKSAVNV